jgi:hypothetical protein
MMQKFGKKAFEAIVRNYFFGMLDVRDTGVWPSADCIEYDASSTLLWNPACELKGPDTPDPLEAPGLPIPFTASELAAFMLDGIGACIPASYGGWKDGPYEDMLSVMGARGVKAREVLCAAYASIRDAEAQVGILEENLEIYARKLADELDIKNGEANMREGVFEQGISTAEANARRVRASKSVADLYNQFTEAKQRANDEFEKWRMAMVNQLLGSNPKLEVVKQSDAVSDRPKLVLPVGTWKVVVAEIPTMLAEAVQPKLFIERQRFKIPGEQLEDTQARDAAYRSEQVQLEAKRRENFSHLRTAFIANKLVAYSKAGLPCDPETDGAYLILKDFIAYIERAIPSVVVSVTEAVPKMELVMSEKLKPIQRTTAQDKAILLEIERQGFKPMEIPKNRAGRSGAKAEIRKALSTSLLFVGSTVFDKAWVRMTRAGDIMIKH